MRVGLAPVELREANAQGTEQRADRSDQKAVVVNLDIEPVEKPEAVRRVDPIHREA